MIMSEKIKFSLKSHCLNASLFWNEGGHASIPTNNSASDFWSKFLFFRYFGERIINELSYFDVFQVRI